MNGTQYGGTLASHPYDNDNLNNSVRINNAVKYQSVDYGGFKLGALYGFSNAAGSFADSRASSVGASYTFGGLKVAAGPKYNQVTLQTAYALSKRTDVYAEAAYQHVGSTGNSGVTADIVGVSASSTDTQVVGTVGIRHRFQAGAQAACC
ncbi:hypothetical protein LMG28614_02548 [Paraburkholderia ultramafica]|uniref:Porin domain-containing protein n=1 Tax=Paraburkholderia ultramafica TaxID=1544867 RepID=A0A6S7CTC8_9BURK|nr:hypothetical protein LMG28614_02548 [Paraburkholderia ultramafica]